MSFFDRLAQNKRLSAEFYAESTDFLRDLYARALAQDGEAAGETFTEYESAEGSFSIELRSMVLIRKKTAPSPRQERQIGSAAVSLLAALTHRAPHPGQLIYADLTAGELAALACLTLDTCPKCGTGRFQNPQCEICGIGRTVITLRALERQPHETQNAVH